MKLWSESGLFCTAVTLHSKWRLNVVQERRVRDRWEQDSTWRHSTKWSRTYPCTPVVRFVTSGGRWLGVTYRWWWPWGSADRGSSQWRPRRRSWSRIRSAPRCRSGTSPSAACQGFNPLVFTSPPILINLLCSLSGAFDSVNWKNRERESEAGTEREGCARVGVLEFECLTSETTKIDRTERNRAEKQSRGKEARSTCRLTRPFASVQRRLQSAVEAQKRQRPLTSFVSLSRWNALRHAALSLTSLSASIYCPPPSLSLQAAMTKSRAKA